MKPKITQVNMPQSKNFMLLTIEGDSLKFTVELEYLENDDNDGTIWETRLEIPLSSNLEELKERAEYMQNFAIFLEIVLAVIPDLEIESEYYDNGSHLYWFQLTDEQVHKIINS